MKVEEESLPTFRFGAVQPLRPVMEVAMTFLEKDSL